MARYNRSRYILMITAIAAVGLYVHLVLSICSQIRGLRASISNKQQLLSQVAASITTLAVLERQLGPLVEDGSSDTLASLARLIDQQGGRELAVVGTNDLDHERRIATVEITVRGVRTSDVLDLVEAITAGPIPVKLEQLYMARDTQAPDRLLARLRVSGLQAAGPNKKGLYLTGTGPKGVESKAAR